MTPSQDYPGWRDQARVSIYLNAHRLDLRPLAVQRCPECPERTLAEVHMVDGNRWAWTPGTRTTPAGLTADGIDPATWPKSAPGAFPLEPDRAPPAVPATCPGCRLTYTLDSAAMKRCTTVPSSTTVTLPPPSRLLR